MQTLAHGLTRLASLIRGRMRLARGPCPACSSEPRAAEECGVCRGYDGPFPVEDATLLRWSWRFQNEALQPATARVALVTQPARRPLAALRS